jgi:hypothetical protein
MGIALSFFAHEGSSPPQNFSTIMDDISLMHVSEQTRTPDEQDIYTRIDSYNLIIDLIIPLENRPNP